MNDFLNDFLVVSSFAAIFGLFFGSFLGLVIYRLHAKESGILAGRSFCDSCKKILRFMQMIPVFSAVFYGLKCSSCKKKIPSIYTVIEFSFSLLMFGFCVFFNSQNLDNLYLHVLAVLPIVFVMLFVFYYDLLYQQVHDYVLIPGIVYAFFYAFLNDNLPSGIIGAFLGASFFGIQYFASKGKWVGSGDIFIALFLGLFLGYKLMLLTLMIAYILGSLVGIFLLILKKAKRDSQIALGPFLIIASLASFFKGEFIINLFFI